MTLLDWIILLVVAALCGAVGRALTGYGRGGLITSIALGFIGALFGLLIARSVGLPEPFYLVVGDQHFPIIWSIVGAALFVAVLGLLTRPRRGYWY
jgi:uncharacterized membrane protein YeaQ/YmgE (transglycosylase-associated protein family)